MKRQDRLNSETIKSGLKCRLLGSELLIVDCTASTNDLAWQRRESSASGLCLFAEKQTAGRGRHRTKWFSGAGDSILCSVLLKGQTVGSEMIILASAVAVAEAVRTAGAVDARIKWPNDIIIGGRKTAGILAEAKQTDGRSDYVIGIGINCHQQQEFFAGHHLRMPATSIDIESSSFIDRNTVARALVASLDKWLVVAGADEREVVTAWQQLSALLGCRVTVQHNRSRFSGNCVGIDPQHGLILQLEGGGVRMFEAVQTTIIDYN